MKAAVHLERSISWSEVVRSPSASDSANKRFSCASKEGGLVESEQRDSSSGEAAQAPNSKKRDKATRSERELTSTDPRPQGVSGEYLTQFREALKSAHAEAAASPGLTWPPLEKMTTSECCDLFVKPFSSSTTCQRPQEHEMGVFFFALFSAHEFAVTLFIFS